MPEAPHGVDGWNSDGHHWRDGEWHDRKGGGDWGDDEHDGDWGDGHDDDDDPH
jgi:hypothetical protein